MRLNDVGSACLTGLALLLPFEARRPLLHLSFVQITCVELLLYVVIFIWGLGWVGGQWRSWSICHLCVLIWALAVVLSALFAPYERAAAAKFALRSLGGCALFYAAADLSATYRRVRQYALALAAGAALSALAGCGEVLWPWAAGMLSVFKTQPSAIGGILRASGTFQYANIAAMYWEAAAPLCLVAALVPGTREKQSSGRTLLALAALVLTVEAIMLSLSRAAIFVVLIVLGLCLALARSTVPIRRPVTAACGLAMVLPFLGHFMLADSFRLRLKAPEESSWYRASYAGALDPMELKPGQALLLRIRIRNIGTMIWPSGGAHRVALSYHWEDPRRRGFIVWDGLRTPLPGDILPGGEVELRVPIMAPVVAGHYVLHLDMAHEGATWFSLQGSPALKIPVELRGPAPDGAALSDALPLFRPVESRMPTRVALWRAALELWKDHPILGVGPDNFRLIYGPYVGQTNFDNRIHSNNLYFEMLANLGVLGLVSLGAVIISVSIMMWRCGRQPAAAEVQLLMLGLGASLTAFLLHGFADYFLEFTPTYALFWLIMGMATGLARSRKIS